jgi:3-deoxy-manno-octulosonate cytidylyltransferase (CMP-KDO synthetase)
MLWHVYQRCLKVTKVEAVHIATDSEEVARLVRGWGGQAWLTDPACESGTARIVSILDKLEGDIIVNVQGDQPLIDPNVIDQLIAVFERTTPFPDIVTPACLLSDDNIFDPNVVKVVMRHDGYALYFSRSPIPYVRDVETAQWLTTTPFWGHIGIYGYRRQVLEEYNLLSDSPLERAEKLEQLRFLQAGKRIFIVETSQFPLSVDTPTDLEKVRAMVEVEKRI